MLRGAVMKTRIYFYLLCTVVIAAGAAIATKKSITIIPAFSKASSGVRQQATAPDWVHWEIRRISPDKKYIAQIVVSDGEVGYLRIFRYDKNAKTLSLKNAVTRQFADVQGCVWVPGHSHWLAASLGGYIDAAPAERGQIFLWKDVKKIQILRRAKEVEEGFNIRGVASDGTFLLYEHFGKGSPDPDYKRNTRFKLYVPRK
jgi:hypothetical protein